MKTVSYKDPYEVLPVVMQIEDYDEEGLAEIIAFLNDDARLTQNMERKERYHIQYHLEGLEYEGSDYATHVDVAADVTRNEEEKRIDEWLRENLTVVQYQRFKQFIEGMSIREIARSEEIDYSSANELIKGSQKNLKMSLEIPNQVTL